MVTDYQPTSLASSSFTGTAVGVATAWNGGYCHVCGARWLGTHSCTPADLHRKIAELYERLAIAEAAIAPVIPGDRMAGCPCRPENGGSGVCGCVLGGPHTTC